MPIRLFAIACFDKKEYVPLKPKFTKETLLELTNAQT
jgi:hypothetical protein